MNQDSSLWFCFSSFSLWPSYTKNSLSENYGSLILSLRKLQQASFLSILTQKYLKKKKSASQVSFARYWYNSFCDAGTPDIRYLSTFSLDFNALGRFKVFWVLFQRSPSQGKAIQNFKCWLPTGTVRELIIFEIPIFFFQIIKIP